MKYKYHCSNKQCRYLAAKHQRFHLILIYEYELNKMPIIAQSHTIFRFEVYEVQDDLFYSDV